MALLDELIRKTDTLLNRFTPLDRRTAYKRVVTRTGADDLISRPTGVTTEDTELSPQPFFKRSGRTRFSGEQANAEFVLKSATEKSTADDMYFIISVNALSEEELTNVDTRLVLSDGSTEEVFRIMDYESPSLQGGVVLWKVYGRSIERT